MLFVCFSISIDLSSWDNFLKVSDSKVLNHSVSYPTTFVLNYFISCILIPVSYIVGS